MKQTIGFDKQELERNFRFILGSVERLDEQIRMMEEQGLGLRDNLDWQSSAYYLRLEFERVKRGLNDFGVNQVSFIDFETKEAYLERHLSHVTENFCKNRYEERL